MEIMLVGLGGLLGSCLRLVITKSCSSFGVFPFGTLYANVLAGLCIGIIAGLDEQYHVFSPQTKQFLTMGILGGLSTFSTFSLESYRLLQQEKWLLAGGNILLNVGLSFLFLALGLRLVRFLPS